MNANYRNPRITVTNGLSGWFAILFADFEDMNWNPDVVDTGHGRYKSKDLAILEAKHWSEAENIPFIL